MFLNRLKILLLLFILLFLSVLFWQNRELLSLKLLCPDINQSCLYQTPELPLAIWMLIFTLAGLFTSLIGQLLNYLSIRSSIKNNYSSTTSYVAQGEDKSKSPRDSQKVADSPRLQKDKPSIARASDPRKTAVNPNNSNSQSDWEDNNLNDDWITEKSTQPQTPEKTTSEQIKGNKNYDVPSQSPTVSRSSSTYSYKYSEGNESNKKRVDKVYDANYKIINPPLQQNNNENINAKEDEDDEDWI